MSTFKELIKHIMAFSKYDFITFECFWPILFTLRTAEVWGVWAMVGVQGRVAFGLRHFCVLSFLKRKFRPANSHEDPNLTMHWHRQMGNVAG